MERLEFELGLDGDSVPGVLFLPVERQGAVPLVLAQHGGSSHKLGQEILDWVEIFVGKNRMALVSIDGPVHGDRRAGGASSTTRSETLSDFFSLWKSSGSGIDKMIRDWRAVLDWVSSDERIDKNSIGWLGLSMGTAYGMPLLAKEPRIKAAVIGMWGLSFDNSSRLADDAPHIACPVLFQQKWDDELFTREGQLSLFERIGDPTKRLNVYPGAHVQVRGQQLVDLEDFLVGNLTTIY